MIRSRRRDGESVEEPLQELYRFATLYDLVHPPREPGADDTIEAAEWGEVEHLELPYPEVGYERLTLLNKTDRKWLVEAWGEPNAHLLPVARRQPRTTEAKAICDAGEAAERGSDRDDAGGAERSGDTDGRGVPEGRSSSEDDGVQQADALHEAPSSKHDESTEDADQVEVYRPPSPAAFEAALAPKPRHKYEGGAVPVPEGHEDPVYDLMERLAKPSAGSKRRRKAKLLKRALVLTGFSSDD